MHRSLACFVLLLAACARPAEEETEPPPKVTVARPLSREVVEWDEYTGRLQAIESVDIRAQVSGYLQSVAFQDGAMVKKGDLLFVIDPRPYEAAVNRARAELDLAQARLELGRRELNRAQQLLKQHSISEEEHDARAATVRQGDASVAAARAALEAAALNVEFTKVTAPINGRVGRHLADEGNLVVGGPANATLLTTIVSLDPIHCYFETDERSYLKYLRLAQGPASPSSRAARSPVQIGLSDEEGFPHKGWMDFVDNQLDPNTGTMISRALLDNANLLLVPGLFVRLRLMGSGSYPALLLPDEAIGTDQAQRFVWIVDANNHAEYRRIAVGTLYEGLRIVHEGLTGEERVVVAGIQRVKAGLVVVPQETSIVLVPTPTPTAARGA